MSTAASHADLCRKKAMDIAKAPFGGLFMKAFMLYMVGSGVHLFSIMAVFGAMWQPVKAIFNVSSAFTDVEHPDVDLTVPKLTFVAINCLGLGIGLYRLGTMGLLPLTAADWHGMLESPQFQESSAGPLM